MECYSNFEWSKNIEREGGREGGMKETNKQTNKKDMARKKDKKID